MVAIARLRYRTVVAASAIPITRGSCRDGSANRVVSGATASQPTNDSISVVAACPTDSQPCGANGVQLASARRGRRSGHRHDDDADQQAHEDKLRGGARPQAAGREREHDQQQHRGDRGPGDHAAAGEAGDVARPDEAHDGSTAHDSQSGTTSRSPGPRAAPRPAVTYPVTPPAEGTFRPSAENTAANRPDKHSKPSQARIDAGPACAAARPGRSRRPGPSRAPM